MAKSSRNAVVNAKAGFILNEWPEDGLSGSLDWFDVTSGFTAIAGETAGDWDPLLGKLVSSSS